MGKVIISGLEPGFGGVPRFLEYLDPSIHIICPRKIDKKGRVVNKFHKYLLWLKDIVVSRKRHAILMHHNSIPTPYLIIIYLIYKHVQYFAIDNSYFCNKSYNVLSGKACLLCLGNLGASSVINRCRNFPAVKNILSAFVDRLIVRKICQNTVVYSLSDASSSLIGRNFGTRAITVGFSTIELRNELSRSHTIVSSVKKNIVFHGSNNEAKGFLYAINLANEMVDHEFIFPMRKPSEMECSPNCTFLDVRWETGLSGLIENALFVLCPSTWSYTPEAAMLKSFILNDNVGFFEIENSFSDNIPENLGLRLSGDIVNDASRIRDNILGVSKTNLGKSFVSNFLDQSDNSIKKHLLD